MKCPRCQAENREEARFCRECERKQVTVLFADLKGSMELLTDRDPEEARKILDPVRTDDGGGPSL
jgi:class 3 adenylate cyclase